MLKIRKRIGSMPLFTETQDGTALHLNGEKRPVIGSLLRAGGGERLRLCLRDGYREMFAPFVGYEIEDDIDEVRRLMRLMSAHYTVMWEGEHESGAQA